MKNPNTERNNYGGSGQERTIPSGRFETLPPSSQITHTGIQIFSESTARKLKQTSHCLQYSVSESVFCLQSSVFRARPERAVLSQNLNPYSHRQMKLHTFHIP